MRYFKISVLIIISYILELAVFSKLKLFGVVPNMVLVLVVCFSLGENDWMYAGILGALSGFLIDMSASSIVGLNALLCMYTGVLCSALSQKFFRGKFTVSILFVFVLSIIYELLVYVFGFALFNESDFLFSVLKIILPVAFLNTIFAVIMYVPVKNINKAYY